MLDNAVAGHAEQSPAAETVINPRYIAPDLRRPAIHAENVGAQPPIPEAPVPDTVVAADDTEDPRVTDDERTQEIMRLMCGCHLSDGRACSTLEYCAHKYKMCADYSNEKKVNTYYLVLTQRHAY